MVKSWKGMVVVVLFGLALGWFGWPAAKSLMKAEPAEVRPAAMAVSQVSPEPVEASQDIFVCPCGGPGWCVGPRGGVYCIDQAGKKKYRPK